MTDGKTRYADDQTLEYIAKLEADRDKLRELVDAVHAPKLYDGVRFRDINGVNWFDARDALKETKNE